MSGSVKYGLVARKAKDMRCVVFCLSKGDEATGAAHLDRFANCINGNATVLDTVDSRFKP